MWLLSKVLTKSTKFVKCNFKGQIVCLEPVDILQRLFAVKYRVIFLLNFTTFKIR